MQDDITTEHDSPEPRDSPRGRRLIKAAWVAGVLLVASVVSLCLATVLRQQRQVAAIREIESLGGRVVTVPIGPEWLRDFVGEERMEGLDEIALIDLSRRGIPIGRLAALSQLRNVKVLSLHATQNPGVALKNLSARSNLSWLQLKSSEVEDADLAHLSKLSRLRLLSLGGTRVTDEGAKEFRHLRELESLLIHDTQVTDNGLVHVSRLTKLARLSVGGEVTDEGLLHLKKLANLKVLYLYGDNFGDDAVAELQKRLSACQIVRRK